MLSRAAFEVGSHAFPVIGEGDSAFPIIGELMLVRAAFRACNSTFTMMRERAVSRTAFEACERAYPKSGNVQLASRPC